MDVELINAALDLIAEPAMNGETARGRVQDAAVRTHLRLRREVLEGNKWSANEKVAQLAAEDGGLVPAGFDYVGVLPADFLGLWSATACKFSIVLVGEGEAARKRLAWSGDATVTICYAADISFALMNPLLAQHCAARLAARLAIVQSEKAQDRKIHADLAVQDEIRAVARDTLNRREDPQLFPSNWDTANVGGGYDPTRGGW